MEVSKLPPTTLSLKNVYDDDDPSTWNKVTNLVKIPCGRTATLGKDYYHRVVAQNCDHVESDFTTPAGVRKIFPKLFLIIRLLTPRRLDLCPQYTVVLHLSPDLGRSPFRCITINNGL